MGQKPGLARVPSDDCTITVGGVEYTPHEGEWAEVITGFRVQDLKATRAMDAMRVKLDALKGEAEEYLQAAIVMDEGYDSVVELLRDRVVAWSWKDDAGRPFAQPPEDPGVFGKLRVEEVLYLFGAVQAANPAARKNGSRPSPTTSSRTRSQPSRA